MFKTRIIELYEICEARKLDFSDRLELFLSDNDSLPDINSNQYGNLRVSLESVIA